MVPAVSPKRSFGSERAASAAPTASGPPAVRASHEVAVSSRCCAAPTPSVDSQSHRKPGDLMRDTCGVNDIALRYRAATSGPRPRGRGSGGSHRSAQHVDRDELLLT